MAYGFPSKLTDYTATGLPLVIYGPPYCSAITWAKENPGVAEIVDREDGTALAEVVERLARSPEHRRTVGATSLAVGARLFSYDEAIGRFYSALVGATADSAVARVG
jgi:glycosyltransferase involved in cell wall biosynthesis